MSSAPQCFIEPVENIPQPSPTAFPSIPQATNMNSAFAAINAMRQMLLQMSGQLGQSTTAGPSQAQGGGKINTGGQQKQKKQQNKKARWVETNRATQKITLKSTDGSVEFDLMQINMLELTDSVTGEKWVWRR